MTIDKQLPPSGVGGLEFGGAQRYEAVIEQIEALVSDLADALARVTALEDAAPADTDGSQLFEYLMFGGA